MKHIIIALCLLMLSGCTIHKQDYIDRFDEIALWEKSIKKKPTLAYCYGYMVDKAGKLLNYLSVEVAEQIENKIPETLSNDEFREIAVEIKALTLIEFMNSFKKGFNRSELNQEQQKICEILDLEKQKLEIAFTRVKVPGYSELLNGDSCANYNDCDAGFTCKGGRCAPY